MRKILIFVALITASVASALAQGERIGTRQWKLVQVAGINVTASSKAYLELNTNEGKFTGNAGCNRMFGSVDVQGQRIAFSGVGTTKMACVDPSATKVETAFVRALAKADRFKVQADRLDLYDRNLIVARLKAPTKHSPDDGGARPDLTRMKWMLEAIRGATVAKAGQSAFLVFDEEKGSAGGNSSCNVFGGSYSADRTTIAITDVVSTMRACVENNRMRIEREFLDGLRDANRYEIVRGRLRFYRNQRLILTLRGERK